MSRSTIQIYPPSRWRRVGWISVAAVLAGLALGAAWRMLPSADVPTVPARTATSAALPPAMPTAPTVPLVAREPRPATTALVPTAPLAAAAVTHTPPLSTLVAPGVHVTALSVPPGTLPMPAGPTAHDTEDEN